MKETLKRFRKIMKNEKKTVVIDGEHVAVNGEPHIDMLGDAVLARVIKPTDVGDYLNGYTLVYAVPTWDGEPIEDLRPDRRYNGMAYTFLNPDIHASGRRKILYVTFDTAQTEYILVETL